MAPTAGKPGGDVPVTFFGATGGSILLLWLILWSPEAWVPIQMILAVFLFIFTPGYLLLGALYPQAPDRGGSIDQIERLVLSVGLSVSILVIVGVVLAISNWGITRTNVLLALGSVSTAFGLIAIDQWMQLAPADRYRLVTVESGASITSPGLAMANALLVISVVAAVTVFGYGLAVPQEAGGFSEVTIMGEDEDGQLQTSALPDTLALDEPLDVVLELQNHEGDVASYTILVVVDGFDGAGQDAPIVHSNQLDRFEVELADGAQWERTLDTTLTMPGDHQRISILVYVGTVPFFPDRSNADYVVHFWVDVSE